MTTVKHWMVLFVGLMLEIYHCWLPLQERIPPICPWGWSDTSRVLVCSLDCLYFTLEGCLIWTDLSLGMVLYEQIVCLLSHGDGLIKADRPLMDLWGWFGIEKPFVYWATLQAALLCDTRSAVYLYKLYFCHVCSQMY